MLKTYLKIAFLWLLIFCQTVLAEESSPKKLVVVLDWLVNPNHAPLLVAQEQGLFRKHNLEVQLITPSDPSDPPKWVALGKADIAIDYEPHALIAIAKGMPLRLVGTLVNQPLNCLVVLDKSGIKSIKDFKGKRVGYSSPQIDLLMLETVLNHEGLDLGSIYPINVHYNLTQALLAGSISAAIGMMRNVELVQLRQMGVKVQAFFPENYGFPSYSELVFIANKNEKLDDRLADFFQAIEEGKNYMAKHPDKTWRQFSGSHPELKTTLNQTLWTNNIKLFIPPFRGINTAQCKRLSDFLATKLHLSIPATACSNH